MKSGFVALVGRPNAGKSTLVNQIVGRKVSIVSNKPQTTRRRVLGVYHQSGEVSAGEAGEGEASAEAQLVFVDTPGIHKPVTVLGETLNASARSAVRDLDELDVACLVLNAHAAFGRGDAGIWDSLPAGSAIVVTQCDSAKPHQIAEQLEATKGLDADAYFAVSGVTGEGVDDLVRYLVGRMPEGPGYFPPEQFTDLPEAWRMAEVVREELLRVLSEELPYSVATRVVAWEGKHVRCEILVERESQKPMVIGHGGERLKQIGTRARAQMERENPELAGMYLELVVKVEQNWQRRAEVIDRLLEITEPD